MEIVEKAKKIIQDIVLPELEVIKGENKDIKTILELTNKRLDDITAHLVDQSRRIDETNKKMDEINRGLIARIDETNKKIDEVNRGLIARIDEVNRGLIARIDEVNRGLIIRIDETNNRLNRLYEVIVRRDEHEKLEIKVMKIEQDIAEMKEKIQYKIAA